MARDRRGSRAMPGNFHGEVRHTLGFRTDSLKERAVDKLKEETVVRAKAATVGKVTAKVRSAGETRKLQRKLAGLERARDILPAGSAKRANADKMIARFKENNDL